MPFIIINDSFLLSTAYIVNHSKSYTIAALASWTEFWVEYYFFGGSKLRVYVSVVGVLLVLLGQVCSH